MSPLQCVYIYWNSKTRAPNVAITMCLHLMEQLNQDTKCRHYNVFTFNGTVKPGHQMPPLECVYI